MYYLHCIPKIVQSSAQAGTLLQTIEDKVMTAVFLYAGKVPVRMEWKTTSIAENVASEETFKGTVLSKMKDETNADALFHVCFFIQPYCSYERLQ